MLKSFSGVSRANYLSIPLNIVNDFNALLENAKTLPVTTSLLSNNPIVAKTIKAIGKEKHADLKNAEDTSYITAYQSLSNTATEVYFVDDY